MQSPKEIIIVLEESHDISPLKLPGFSPHMLSVQHIICLAS
jgi:hypothetical protein